MTEQSPFITKWAIAGAILGAVFMAVAEVLRGSDYPFGIGVGTIIGGYWGMLIMKTVETDRRAMRKMIVGAIAGAIVAPFLLKDTIGMMNRVIAMAIIGTLWGAMIGADLRWATIGAVVGFIFGVVVLLIEHGGGVRRAPVGVIGFAAGGAAVAAFVRISLSMIAFRRSIAKGRDQ